MKVVAYCVGDNRMIDIRWNSNIGFGEYNLENGEIDVIVGTHTLLSDKIVFKNLGLIITDEQHRFGVAQRAILKEREKNSHVLVMSATPIPRTLALALYGDLDISVQKEIFKILSPEKNIGVSLTDSMLMTPTKSVTAFIGINEE